MKRTDSLTGLRAERQVFIDCIAAYDRLISHVEDPESALEESLDNPDRTATLEGVSALTERLSEPFDAAPADHTATNSASTRCLTMTGLRLPAVVLVSLLLIGTIAHWLWFQVWPVHSALQSLQGAWQQVEKNDRGESAKDYFRGFDGDQMSVEFPVPPDRQWHKYNRKVELRPAQGFYLMKLTNVPGQRPEHWTEMFVRIADDQVHEVRGLHPIDPIRIPVVYSWRRGERDASGDAATDPVP